MFSNTARMAGPRHRALIQNGALSLGSLLVGAFILEAALRALGFPSEEGLAARRIHDGRWTTLLDCYPSNPRGYFEIDLRLPENDARYRRLAPKRFDAIQRRHPWAVETRYNALRFRDTPPGPKAKGVTRVVLFGDSFIEGQGVKAGDTTAFVLQRLLERRAPGEFEVRNCGRRGLDFPELSDAFEAILPLEPEVLVYGLVLNDALRPPEFQARQSYLHDWILDREHLPDDEEGPPTLWRPFLLDLVRGRVKAWRVGRETTRWYLEMWSDANPGWRETQARLLEMDRQLKSRGGRLVVAPWPLLVGLEESYPFEAVHETIRRFCLARGLAYHDLLAAFRGRRTADFWVHPVDHHPNERAHLVAASSLEPAIAPFSR